MTTQQSEVETIRTKPGIVVNVPVFPELQEIVLADIFDDLMSEPVAAVDIEPCSIRSCFFQHVAVDSGEKAGLHHFEQFGNVVLSKPGLHRVDDTLYEIIWEDA